MGCFGGAIDALQRLHLQLVQRAVGTPGVRAGRGQEVGGAPQASPRARQSARPHRQSHDACVYVCVCMCICTAGHASRLYACAPAAVDVAICKGQEAADGLEVDGGELLVRLFVECINTHVPGRLPR